MILPGSVKVVLFFSVLIVFQRAFELCLFEKVLRWFFHSSVLCSVMSVLISVFCNFMLWSRGLAFLSAFLCLILSLIFLGRGVSVEHCFPLGT
jgi:hypothetical protein